MAGRTGEREPGDPSWEAFVAGDWPRALELNEADRPTAVEMAEVDRKLGDLSLLFANAEPLMSFFDREIASFPAPTIQRRH